MFFSLSPDPPKSPNLESRLTVPPMNKGHPRSPGPGWTELSCVCLSTPAVQNIRSPVQQAQTGSHMTTQPEWQPAIERKQPSHHVASTPRATTKTRGAGGAWGFHLLVEYLTRMYDDYYYYYFILTRILKPTKSKVSHAYGNLIKPISENVPVLSIVLFS